MIDVEALLAEISPDAPCGGDLEYDPAYGELERLVKGKEEQQIGDTIVPAEEPDWAEVQRQAISLFGRTKDLRVAAILTQAIVHTQGWSGLRDGLKTMHGLLERYWDTVNPPLDPDDDHDPTLRVNVLVTVCDPETILYPLRLAPLIESRVIGRFGLRDIQIATGELPSPAGSDTSPTDWRTIEAAFKAVELDDLRATADAVDQSRQLIAAIDAILSERVGAGAAPDFSPLTEIVKAAQKAIATPLAERTGQTISPAGHLSDPDPANSDGQSDEVRPTTNATALGPLDNRDDVVRALDLLCDYYRRAEPSSPIPLLLQRAKRLVGKDFYDILRDLAPGGLSQAEGICGSDPGNPV